MTVLRAVTKRAGHQTKQSAWGVRVQVTANFHHLAVMHFTKTNSSWLHDEMPLPHSGRPNHNNVTIVSGVEEIYIPVCLRFAYNVCISRAFYELTVLLHC